MISKMIGYDYNYPPSVSRSPKKMMLATVTITMHTGLNADPKVGPLACNTFSRKKKPNPEQNMPYVNKNLTN
jgi:hypothetical protein